MTSESSGPPSVEQSATPTCREAAWEEERQGWDDDEGWANRLSEKQNFPN